MSPTDNCRDLAGAVATSSETVTRQSPVSQLPEISRHRNGRCRDFASRVARSPDIVARSSEAAAISRGNVATSFPESQLPRKLRLFPWDLSRDPFRCREISPSRDNVFRWCCNMLLRVARSPNIVATCSDLSRVSPGGGGFPPSPAIAWLRCRKFSGQGGPHPGQAAEVWEIVATSS